MLVQAPNRMAGEFGSSEIRPRDYVAAAASAFSLDCSSVFTGMPGVVLVWGGKLSGGALFTMSCDAIWAEFDPRLS